MSVLPQVIDGKALSQDVILGLKQEVAQLTTRFKRPPSLATVLVGAHAASQIYVRNKRKTAFELGIKSVDHDLDASVSESELLECITQLNNDPNIDGILVQLPLPQHIDENRILCFVDVTKDVDGFHPQNAGLLALGRPRFVPCTPLGCMMMLQKLQITLNGAHAVVVGRSNIVGKPMAQLLLAQNATVTMCHSHTKDLASITKQADVLIAAVGVPHLIRAEHVKEGAVVIDVGINRLESGKLVGDVHMESVLSKVKAISPVPGGVGPMTIAMLMQNTLTAYRMHVGA